MKKVKILLSAIAVSLVLTATSQELPRHVFCSGGGHYQSAVMQVSWTIGQAEPVATTSQPTVIFCPGFQQYDDQTVSIKEIISHGEFRVYPNPCRDFVILDVNLDAQSSLSYRLYDFSGKLLLSNEFSSYSDHFHEVIGLGELPRGIYNLQLTAEEAGAGMIKKSIKLIRN
jgi:hypothetical protein